MSNTPVILKPLQRFSLRKMNASVLLFVSALLAMVWANSSWAHLYNDFLARPVILQISSYNLFSHAGETMSLLEFVNDALMSVFF